MRGRSQAPYRDKLSGPGATLIGMAFKLNRNGPEPAREFGDKDKFEILAGAHEFVCSCDIVVPRRPVFEHSRG